MGAGASTQQENVVRNKGTTVDNQSNINDKKNKYAKEEKVKDNIFFFQLQL